MNAKKIMGAVLVAFLAAALFIGAGAAAAEGDQGTYFAYQKTIPTSLVGVWQNGANTVTVNANGNVSDVPEAGTYTLGKMTAYFTKPTATYSAIGNASGTKYIVSNGGTIYKGDNLTIGASSLNNTIAIQQLRFEYPNGEVVFLNANTYEAKMSSTGTYKVQAVWNESSENFTVGAPLPYVDANVFTFTVVDPSEVTLTASVDTIFAGDVISVTIKGIPGATYNLTLTGINASVQEFNQIVKLQNIGNEILQFKMPNIGEVTFQLETMTGIKDDVEIELTKKDDSKVLGEVAIAVVKPTVSATLGATSYFIGDEIELTVSSDLSIQYTDYNFTITGTNFNEVDLTTDDEENNGKSFTVNLLTENVKDNGKKLDVGTYTIKIYKGAWQGENVEPVKTVTVALKQPFISIIEAPEVVVQGKKAEFVINAEATDNITAYIFGTNYFYPAGIIKADKDVSNKFVVELDKYKTSAKNMSAGQYFAVFQHPMYDTFYNIYPEAGTFYLDTEATATSTNGTPLFNVSDRQTANAAQALCDALDSQNIDDMYVKASFFVVGEDESFTISEIPSTIAQGETLTISGVSTSNADETVTVEMLSTAFAAVPKETVGSAAFILVTTEVAEDGTWEVTLDTSDLNVDEYSLKVACGDDTWKNVKINVVEGAETPDTPDTPDVPDTPDTPDEPEAPATPGFGALAALAGLGAVAVLLLRRE